MEIKFTMNGMKINGRYYSVFYSILENDVVRIFSRRGIFPDGIGEKINPFQILINKDNIFHVDAIKSALKQKIKELKNRIDVAEVSLAMLCCKENRLKLERLHEELEALNMKAKQYI